MRSCRPWRPVCREVDGSSWSSIRDGYRLRSGIGSSRHSDHWRGSYRGGRKCRRGDDTDSAEAVVGNIQIPGAIGGNPRWRTKRRAACRAAVSGKRVTRERISVAGDGLDDSAACGHFADGIVVAIGYVEVSRTIESHGVWTVQSGAASWSAILRNNCPLRYWPLARLRPSKSPPCRQSLCGSRDYWSLPRFTFPGAVHCHSLGKLKLRCSGRTAIPGVSILSVAGERRTIPVFAATRRMRLLELSAM